MQGIIKKSGRNLPGLLGLTALVLLLASVASQAASEDDRGPGTVQDTVFLSLEFNPEVQELWHAFLSAGFDKREAQGAYLPTVEVTANGGRQRRSFDARGGFDVNSAEISLTQMLFDGFRTKNDVERLEKSQQVRFFELLGIVDSTAFEAVKAYDDVVRYRDLIALVRANYIQHLSIEKQIREQVEQGVGRGTDLDQVSGRVQLTESNLLAEAANLHDVTARYLRIVGSLPSESLVPIELRYEELPESIRDVLYEAYQGNSNFHAAVRNIEALQESVSLQRSRYFPRLELKARTGIQQNLSIYDERVDPRNFGRDTVVELAFTYNLYNGGSDKAAVRRSLSQVDLAMSQRDQACINLRQTVQIAYSDTKLIEERLVALRQHRDSINRVRAAYAEQFQIGQRTLLDVLDAESEYFQSARALVNAEHDLNLAHTQLLAAAGKLLPQLNIVKGELMFFDVGGDMGSINIESSAACPSPAPKSQGINDISIAKHNLNLEELFEAGSANFTEEAPNILDSLVEEISFTDRQVRINIDAYSADADIGLAQTRAEKIKAYFESANANFDYIVANGYIASSNTVDISVSMPLRIDSPERIEDATSVVGIDTEATNRLFTVEEIEASSAGAEDFVASWLDSWERQDLDAYFDHFHEAFNRIDIRSRAEWRADRERRITYPDSIDISYENFEVVEIAYDRAIVHFTMFYSNSAGYADETKKELLLSYENGVWLMKSETNLEVIYP